MLLLTSTLRGTVPKIVAARPSRERADWRETVREGWDSVSYRYRPRRGPGDCFGHADSAYRAWLEPVMKSLPVGSPVLDLGCGTGVPAARMLARRFRVTGVDVSATQLRRARRLVPSGRFLRADLSEVEFAPASFAAVVCLYSLIHVPREEHRAVVRRIATWLAPGGWLVAIVGSRPYEGREDRWLGSAAPMLWSHYGASTYRRWLRESGFHIVREEFVPEGDVGHQLFLARRSRGARTPANARRASGSGRRAPAPLRRSRARRPRGARVRPLSPSRSDGTLPTSG